MQHDWQQAAPAAASLAHLRAGGVNPIFGPDALIGFDPTIASGTLAPPGAGLDGLPVPGGATRSEESTGQEEAPLVHPPSRLLPPALHHLAIPASSPTRPVMILRFGWKQHQSVMSRRRLLGDTPLQDRLVLDDQRRHSTCSHCRPQQMCFSIHIGPQSEAAPRPGFLS